MNAPRNPHFDDGLVVWDDRYSGRYQPPPSTYGEQFDLQWKLALSKSAEWFAHPGASTDDVYIDDRVYEWTGKRPAGGAFRDASAGVRVLDHPLDPKLIEGRRCIDVGCGMGRWTRTMQRLGAREVVSVDISESALESTRRFNDKTFRVNLMELDREHPEWVGAFDFACFWGVAMHTHDPRKAFHAAASTVAPGGAIYLMVYAPEGLHGDPLTLQQRKAFHALDTVEARLAYVEHVFHRKLDPSYRLRDNWRNVVRTLRGTPKGGRVGVLDMLEPYYNWVIPWDAITGWMREEGFTRVTLLNDGESPKCAWHVLGQREGRSATQTT